MNDLKSHWDKAYNRSQDNRLGWYEEFPKPSLSLIKKCDLHPSAYILNVGAGTGTLVDELIKLGYENIIANDISQTAINRLKERLGSEAGKIRWILDDLTNPGKLNHLGEIDLWHDRAVLHFFNDQEDQDSYFTLVQKLVRKDGFVIIAAFNLEGATQCSGLPVFRYNKDMLQDKLGIDFELIEAFDHTYFQPSGDTREYVYTLFKRKNHFSM